MTVSKNTQGVTGRIAKKGPNLDRIPKAGVVQHDPVLKDEVFAAGTCRPMDDYPAAPAHGAFGSYFGFSDVTGKAFYCRRKILGFVNSQTREGVYQGWTLEGKTWQSKQAVPLVGKAIIHVNRQFIAMNAKDGGNRPVFTTKVGGVTIYSSGIDVQGPSSLVAPGEQLKCGARAWIEARAEDLRFKNPMNFARAKAMGGSSDA